VHQKEERKKKSKLRFGPEDENVGLQEKTVRDTQILQ